MTETINLIHVTMDNGRVVECPAYTRVGQLAPSEKSPDGLHYLGAVVNNNVVSLAYPLEVNCEVRFVTLADADGERIYRRSVSFLLAKVVKELHPKAVFSVEHSLGTAFYCSFQLDGEPGIAEDQLEQIERRMRELINRNVPIERRRISYADAVRQFEQEQQWDKFNLLRFSNPPKIVTYWCEGFSDIAHGPLTASTGALGVFRLIRYPPGFLIQFSSRANPMEPAPFEAQPHLFNVFKEHKEWGRILGVNTVGRLNEIIFSHEIGDFIKIAEAFHEKKVAHIADHIHANRGRLRWVLIAGPSSSGKTTFAKRLAVQLRVNGLRPVTISTDNYFVDREHTPKDERGEYDYENLETIDLPLFDEHLRRLDNREEVAMPKFNFERGARDEHVHKLKPGEDDILIVEGIHALNPRLSAVIPSAHKVKIYVSALTQLNLDFHNRIATTDNRLIRRLVRDRKFRGHSALRTLEMWPNVRRGEEKWIFPFQQEADITFNSALDYELAVLKYFAEPLLAEVKPMHPQYGEARRLLDFLSSFLGVPSDLVPPTSILREFIGKSSFHY